MTSTPMHHPDDEARPHPEDQGEEKSSHGDGDLVDEETKQLSREEAEQHDGIVDAQEDEIDAEEGEDSDGEPAQGGYGH